MAEFILEIPIDASNVEDRQRGETVRVTAVAAGGVLVSGVAEVPASGKASVKLRFEERPKNLRIHVGPGTVAPEDLPKLQAIEVPIATARLQAVDRLKLDSLVIKPNVWKLWRGWCRTYKVSGYVKCFDGSPAPGAEVTAFDIDWCWWWISKQSVASAVTDENGYYEMSFTWCCGYWPWWWWNRRLWRLEPGLIDRIKPILRLHPELPEPPRPTPKPDLAVFEQILSDSERPLQRGRFEDLGRTGVLDGAHALDASTRFGGTRFGNVSVRRDLRLGTGATATFDPTHMARLREPLLERLPGVEELSRLRVWPWYPWCGWADCAPDLVMRVTQDCDGEQNKLIVDEGFLQTRWNITTNETIDLTPLFACCRDDTPQPEGDCLNITKVCDVLTSDIGGNPTAPPSPAANAGYASPTVADQPFAGRLEIFGDFGTAAQADYYEFEWLSSTPGAVWEAMPPGAIVGFNRQFFGPELPAGPIATHAAPFPIQEIDGRRVIETRQHFQRANQPATWETVGSGSRWWTGKKTFLGYWVTGDFPDDLYRLRIKTWELTPAGTLTPDSTLTPTTPQILDICGDDDIPTANEIVLRVDNRIITDTVAHGDECGSGTVHTCTDEPETRILSAKIFDGPGRNAAEKSDLAACSEAAIAATDELRIRFQASDTDGHLSRYTLQVTYGENQKRVLIDGAPLLGATLHEHPSVGNHVGPTYSKYLTLVPGASPVWHGGDYELLVDAAAVFPITCCYQLELRAYKRTIVSCRHDHRNLSERSFMVRVPS